MRKIVVILIGMTVFWGCEEHYKPKPKGFLALQFPEHQYVEIKGDCPYTFEVNKIAAVETSFSQKPCMLDIEYPKMKGTIYLTYEPVHHNLRKLLKDAQNLPLKHTIKADEIIGDEYTDSNHHTYGMLYTVTGDAASQAQFYLTDSLKHFMTGSIYFREEPNYDSLYPAAEYLKKDMKKLMETLRWKEE